MAIVFTWKPAYEDASTSPPTLGRITMTDVNTLAFFGSAGFGSAIRVGEYNDNTHVIASITNVTDVCNPHANNFKYIPPATATDPDNLVSVNGGATTTIDTITQDYLILIEVSDDTNTAFEIVQARFYAFDGVDINNPPTNAVVKAFKLGDTTWTQPPVSGFNQQVAVAFEVEIL